MMKDGVVIPDFVRDCSVDDAMEGALKFGKVKRYITDFPNDRTANMEGVNIFDMLNRSKGDYAYTMLDLYEPAPEELIAEISRMDVVLRARAIR